MASGSKRSLHFRITIQVAVFFGFHRHKFQPAHAFVKSSQHVIRPVRTRVSAVAIATAPDRIGEVPRPSRDTTAQQSSAQRDRESVAIAAIARLVQLSSSCAWPVILGFLLLAVVSAGYFTRHFAMTTDSKKLLSSSLPWREQERMLDAAFPHRTDQIIAVIDAATPEAADDAADALVKGLAFRPDVIRSISRPDGGEFFERNGILLLGLKDVQRTTADLISAQPFLATLAADPTLRGVFRTISQSLEGVRRGKAKLEDLQSAVTALADELELLANGRHQPFSWRTLIAGRPAKPSELRRFVNIEPMLDFKRLTTRTQSDRADTRYGVRARPHARTRREGASHRTSRPFRRRVRFRRRRRSPQRA